MKVPSEKHAIPQMTEQLAELVNGDNYDIRLKAKNYATFADGVLHAGPYTFIVEWKGSGSIETVTRAIQQVLNHSRDFKGVAIPLVAVPYESLTQREIAHATGIDDGQTTDKPITASNYKSKYVKLVRAICLYIATKLGDIMDKLVVIVGLFHRC